MYVLTESELPFEIRRAVQSLPRGVLRDLVGKPEPYERGLRAAEEVIYQRLAGYEVRRPAVDLKRWDFGAMKNS